MRQRRILVLGDSHTQSLSKAVTLRNGNESGVGFQVHWLLSDKGERSRGDLRFKDAFEKVSKLALSDVVVISILGTAHNIFGLLQHEQPFDFAVEHRDGAIPLDSSLIPHSQMREMLQDFMVRNKSIRQISGVARCPVFHLSTPPPKQDNEFIRERTKHYRERLVADVGISSPALRLKLWTLEMQVMSSVCESWGVSVLPVPREAQTPEGFLKPEYYAEDATHANAAYGELVLRQLESIPSDRRTASEKV